MPCLTLNVLSLASRLSIPPLLNCILVPTKSLSKTLLTTPATASAPYKAEAPSLRTSRRSRPFTGMELVLTVNVGTKSPPMYSV